MNADDIELDPPPRKGLRGRFSRRQLIATTAAATALWGAPAPAAAATRSNGTLEGFQPDDAALMAVVMDKVPHLLSVAAAIKMCRALHVTYPLADHEDVRALFVRLRARVTLAGHRITWRAVRHFLPPSFFPIQSEDDLIVKLLIAFQRSDFHHAYERRRMSSLALGAPEAPTMLLAPEMPGDEPIPFEGQE